MLEVLLNKDKNDPLKVLVLGAHCDDIEIGCGGAILELASRYPNLSIHWVVLASDDERAGEATACANTFTQRVSDTTIAVERFRDGYFPYIGGQIKDYFEGLKGQLVPDLIFTHFHEDWHQDHRLVCELTWNTWRDHLILEYEVPKYDPDIGSPNCFVHLNEKTAEEKVRHIMRGYPTQSRRHWFTEDTFYGLMRLRGIQSGAARFAEAFYCRKIVIAGP